jgi:hypothetical protein
MAQEQKEKRACETSTNESFNVKNTWKGIPPQKKYKHMWIP